MQLTFKLRHYPKNPWLAQIKAEGINRCLGYFNQEIKTAMAYNEAAKKFFGEFAWLNKID